MKLLTTIAAVLISISAFSQDLIEYNESTYSLNGEIVSFEYKKTMTDFNPDAESMFELSLGTFSRNGEELSMEQIYDLTELHKAGGGNVLRANRFDLMYKSSYLRGTNNTLNFVSGAANGPVGGFLVFFGGALIYWAPGLGIPMTAAGTGLCVVSYKAFSRVASSAEGCIKKRDKEFRKVAEKLNEAIQSSNQ